MKDDHLRLFVAIELPEEWKRALGAQARALNQAAPTFGRWVDPALIHLTLVFLGRQPTSALPGIEEAMARAVASMRPFTLRLDRPGTFGGRRSVRVVWVGVQDAPAVALAMLHGGLARGLQQAGIDFEVDRGPFRPHLTLGRARRDATPTASEALSAAIARRGGERPAWPEGFRCEEITLIRSDLSSTGPKYTPLCRARLSDSTSDRTRT